MASILSTIQFGLGNKWKGKKAALSILFLIDIF